MNSISISFTLACLTGALILILAGAGPLSYLAIPGGLLVMCLSAGILHRRD